VYYGTWVVVEALIFILIVWTMVYPHYYIVANVKISFPLHVAVTMSFYQVSQKTFDLLVVDFFDKLKLESQAFL
jgi:hypothetical protein